MQSTLRYMTKLDRAINNKEQLESLHKLYKSINISANDLFQILKTVIRYFYQDVLSEPNLIKYNYTALKNIYVIDHTNL